MSGTGWHPTHPVHWPVHPQSQHRKTPLTEGTKAKSLLVSIRQGSHTTAGSPGWHMARAAGPWPGSATTRTGGEGGRAPVLPGVLSCLFIGVGGMALQPCSRQGTDPVPSSGLRQQLPCQACRRSVSPAFWFLTLSSVLGWGLRWGQVLSCLPPPPAATPGCLVLPPQLCLPHSPRRRSV